MVLQSSGGSASDTAFESNVGDAYNTSAGCSMEQIFTPVSIVANMDGQEETPGFRPNFEETNSRGPFGLPAGGSSTGGGVGPTVRELNPYYPNIFNSPMLAESDYNCMTTFKTRSYMNQQTQQFQPGESADDMNIHKLDQLPEMIRTQGLRAPMILSGWGFGLDGLPVPNGVVNDGQTVSGNPTEFDPKLKNQRSYWKTGPVDLRWDDQRQVWSGGPQILCGYLLEGEKITKPKAIDKPTAFIINVLRRNSTIQGYLYDEGGQEVSGSEGYSVHLTDSLQEKVSVINRDPSLEYTGNEASKVFVICIRLNYEWLPLWVGCPTDTGGGSSSSSSSSGRFGSSYGTESSYSSLSSSSTASSSTTSSSTTPSSSSSSSGSTGSSGGSSYGY